MNQMKKQLPQPLKILLKKRLNLILERKWFVLGFLGLGLLIALGISLLMPKQYRAVSSISFKYNTVYSPLLTNGGSLDNELRALTSKKVLSKASNKLLNNNFNVTEAQLLNIITLQQDQASTSIIVSAITDDAEKTANVANAIVTSYSEVSEIKSREAYLKTLRSLNDRIKEVQKENAVLQAAQQTAPSVSLNINEERLVTRLTELETELESIEIDNQFYSAQLQYLQKLLDNKYPLISAQILNIPKADMGNSQLIVERLEAKANLSEVVSKLRNFSISYPWTENIDIKDLPKLKQNFNRRLTVYLKNLVKENNIPESDFLNQLVINLYDLQMKVSSIDLSKSIIFNLLNGLEEQFKSIPFANLDNVRQVRSVRFQNKLLIKLKSKEVKLKEREKEFFAETDSIIKAETPGSFFSPNIPLNLFFGALAGLILGVVLALTTKQKELEYITRVEDLEEAGYKIISQIPTFPTGGSLLLSSQEEKNKTKTDPNIVKSFLGIETFLKYGNLDKPLNTIMVSSGYQGEGKSVVASNIAITLANQGSKVLLVDSDLKKPNLNKFFKVKSTPSLAHYLFRKKELDEIIRSTHFRNLDLITCIEFPQNPAVIITSERMKNFMEKVKNDYDYVVYDTASLCDLKETAKIAYRVDEIILVVRANKTKYSELSYAEQLLEEVGITNFNVVLNDIKS